MIRFLLGTVFLGAFGLATAARAEVITPGSGLQATLGATTVTIYYEPTDRGYQVVTTASTEAPDSVVRFVATLAPGQDAVISVPRGVGEPALELHVRRIGDQVELQRPLS